MTQPTQTTQKKGLGPLAWIAIGCGGLIVIGILVATVGGIFVARKAKDVVQSFEENPAKAAAEMAVRINPELELVESDDDAGTMTIRNKETGEVATFNFKDIAEGKFSWETDEGKVEISADQDQSGGVSVKTDQGEARFGSGSGADIPDWVPRYTGTEPAGAFTSHGDGEENGMFSFETADSPKEVLDFFQTRLEEEGYEVNRQIFETAGQEPQGNLSAERSDPQRSVTVVASREDGKTSGAVTYSSRE